MQMVVADVDCLADLIKDKHSGERIIISTGEVGGDFE